MNSEYTPGPMLDPLLPASLVEKATSLHIRTIDRLIAKGQFPKPCAVSEYRRAWKASQVKAWIDARPPADFANKMHKRTAARQH